MTTSIEGEADLDGFRAGLTGRRGLELVGEADGPVLVQLPVGVGKSRWIDEITLEAARGGDYDLVVVLAPTRRIIEERGPLRAPPPGVRVVALRPRPSATCGPERDAAWRAYEKADLGALGRAEVCSACPRRAGCFWPEQYRSLRGAAIVYATHAHVERSPGFLARLKSMAGARRVLTLIDEFDFAGKDYEVIIAAAELDRFDDALRAAPGDGLASSRTHGRWVEVVGRLRDAGMVDLQGPGWAVPRFSRDFAEAVQQAGFRLHGGSFRFLGYRLSELAASPMETRRKGPDGALHFAPRPYVGDALIFSGTTSLAFARHRLGGDTAAPFADHRFSHLGTRWYNLASPLGTRRHFPGNSPQVLDFFAELTARRVATGKRVLLVAKKRFVELCAAGLTERFTARGCGLEVATEGWTEQALARPGVVPLISYGMIGTNLFEDFDCAFCLTGYYVDEWVVDRCLQDTTRGDLRVPIAIATSGDPRRRRAGAADPAHGGYDVAGLAQAALEYKEHGVVVQAVGRVRPFTRPREVVTFQMAELPGVRYDAEFRTLAEARRHFGIATGREATAAARSVRIAALRSEGRTQAEVACLLGVSIRTVFNHERGRTGNEA